MPFPNFEGKHDADSIVSPREFIDHLAEAGYYPKFAMPERVIMCYQESLFRYIVKNEDVEPLPLARYGLHALRRTGGKVGISGKFGIGAPISAMVLEEFIALGATAVLSIGVACALQPQYGAGDLVLCDGGVRDEGVSHHYLPASRFSYPSPRLTETLKASLTAAGLPFGAGPTWTCDAFFRETVAEARHYAQAGVQTLEMEAAALFAVAEYRGVDLGAAFAISDSMAGETWASFFRDPAMQQGLEKLYHASVDALLAF